jgi:uncharacterized protein YcbX
MAAEVHNTLGSLLDLWRFPVKSMQGEKLESARITEKGVLGDRAYAFVDAETGKIASAKNPRKWPNMLACAASFVRPPAAGQQDPPPVRVVFADGVTLSSGEAGFDERASRALGRNVTLRSTPVPSPVLEEYWPDIDGLAHREMVTDEAISLGAPAGSFFDFAQIHLITTSTLAALERAYPQGRFDPCRFRPNLLVRTAEDGFPENDWTRIGVGAEVVLEVVIPCPRCVMTTLPQRDLPHDSGILRTAARQNNVMIAPLGQAMPSAGVYAKVIRGGEVRPGDAVWRAA